MQHNGFRLYRTALDAAAQRALLDEVTAALAQAPPYRPLTPGGKAMSVRMSNLGAWGWITDARGYRYEAVHPLTGQSWPPIPPALLDLWERLAQAPGPPDACLVNLYDAEARMGLHQDKDEEDFAFPVLSVSLGDTAVFRLGGVRRGDATRTLRLTSGDVCILGGAARMFHHGVDRLLPGSSRLMEGGGRINLTLRRARAVPPG